MKNVKWIFFVWGLIISFSLITVSGAQQQPQQDQLVQQQIAQQQIAQQQQLEQQVLDQQALAQQSVDVVVEPDVYLFGGDYYRGRDAHNYSRRGFESRGAAHFEGGRGRR